jgi:early endosome antigen 1
LLQEEKLTLENDVQERTTRCSDLSSDAESKDGRINQLEEGLSETETKVKEMQQAIEDALGKELNLLSDIEEKNKTIFAIEEEKSNIVISFESQQTILERLTSEKDVAEKESRMNKTELQTLEEKICQLQSDIEKERNEIKDEIGELRTARELLLSQVVDLKNEKEKMQSNFETETEKSKLNLAALEKTFHECQKSLDSVTQDLQKEKASNTENQQKAKENVTKLETRLESSNSEVENLSTEMMKLNENIANIDKERDLALSKTLELEAAVGSASEERRGLLERCVAAEAETERTRNMTVELRRKLDDAQAALHELGRENQSIQVCTWMRIYFIRRFNIQVELVKQSGRKWKDDTEVVSCTSCQSGFSLTNRKHHCRNCGNIFCNDCSSKQVCTMVCLTWDNSIMFQANMTGYKKPQRVCEGCFGELGSK